MPAKLKRPDLFDQARARLYQRAFSEVMQRIKACDDDEIYFVKVTEYASSVLEHLQIRFASFGFDSEMGVDTYSLRPVLYIGWLDE